MSDPAVFRAVVCVMSVVAGLAGAINAVELLTMSRALGAQGIWRPENMARRWGPVRVLLGGRGFPMLMVLQLVAAFALIGGACVSASASLLVAAVAALLATTTLLAAVRFGHTVNGGSDAMLFTVFGGLTLAWWPADESVWREAGVLYVAAQLTLSYVRAGWVKLRQPAWWSGRALREFVAFPAYGVPTRVVQLAARYTGTARVVGVAVVMFELAAPFAWWQPTACLVYITLAVLFHAGTAVVFGLNRFLLAWSAALPALWYAMVRTQ